MSAAAVQDDALGDLLERVLEDQGSMTAVDRFAYRHDSWRGEPAESFYEDLIPTRTPGEGEQFAFRVDLDACTGCKACVTACHSLNGLEPGETWRRVGVLVAEEARVGAQQTVTGACHHCVDPGCLNGCPVQAYEKDATTGIVRHLDDQCIGCQYCTLTCPYDVPQYSQQLGIVRKCDMCTDRLAEGEAPACVQGCPNGAISIRVVSRKPSATSAPLLADADANALLPATLTGPTTRYVRRSRAIEEAESAMGASLHPADREVLSPGPAHWPLVALLIGTELSVGLLSVELLIGQRANQPGWSMALLVSAWVAALVGQAASILHLGRPLYFFRAVLGWRTSWMSREVLLLGTYFAGLSLSLAAQIAQSTNALPMGPWLESAVQALTVGTAIVGWMGLLAQIMIYAVTGRPAWSIPRTAPRFLGSVAVFGCCVGIGVALAMLDHATAAPLCVAFAAVFVGKLLIERVLRRRDHRAPLAALVRGARLEDGVLKQRVKAREALCGISLSLLFLGLALHAGGLSGAWSLGLVAIASVGCVASEVLERHLFFVSESARGMPGA